MTTQSKQLIAILAGFVLLLSACNMPGAGGRQAQGAGAIYTAAAQTMAAQLTQVSAPPASPVFFPTFTPQGTPGAQPLPTQPLPTSPPATQAPGTSVPATRAPGTSTSVPLPCDRARFVRDVTIPDDSEMDPGESFVKTWRLENSGSCTWSTAYTLVFSGGDSLGAPASVNMPASVAPGQTVDVSISLKAPQDPGTYRAEFKLRNASNNTFGIGDLARPFWAQIKVPGAASQLFDFLAKASTAEWTTEAGTDSTTLTFDGGDTDPNGVAKIKDAVKLETGIISGKILLTIPRHNPDGMISGLFPAYAVQSGDRLRARIGFMMVPGENSCGVAKARFQVAYKETGGELKLLREWVKSCSGSLEVVDLDLSALRGKTVQFALIVRAEGNIADDWAIWNSPRIE